MGTSRNTRASPALRPGWLAIDERTPRALLAQSSRTAALFNFFDEADAPSGTWREFFTDVALVRYAAIAELDCVRQAQLLREWLQTLQHGPAQHDPAPHRLSDYGAAWSVIDLLLERYRQVDRDARFFAGQAAEADYAAMLRQAIAGTLKDDCATVLRCRAWLEKHQPLLAQAAGWAGRTSTMRPLDLQAEWWHVPSADATPLTSHPHNFVRRLSRAAWSTHATVEQLVQSAADWFERRYAAPSRLPPHFALYLAFIRQFPGSQQALNRIPDRHRDYFYRTVLELRPAGAMPDTALVAFTPAAGAWVELAAGTALTAGEDAAGQPVVYRTTQSLVLTPMRLARLMTTWLQPWTPAASGFYFAAVADSADGLGAPLAPDASWATFGEDQAGRPPAARTMAEAEIGFAIGSPVLHLAGGLRHVTLVIRFAAAAETLGAVSTLAVTPVWTIDYSGAEGWVTVPDAPAPTCVLRYTPARGSAPGTTIAPLDLTIDFTLGTGAAACVNYDPAVLGPGFDPRTPVLRVRYPHPAVAFVGAPAEVAAAFAAAAVASMLVTVDVKQLQALAVGGPTGPLAGDQPLPILGAPPAEKARFTIGNVELFRKQPDALSVALGWQGLPIDPPATVPGERRYPNGLADYYRSYLCAFATPPAAAFHNDQYRVAFAALLGREWRRIDAAPAGLFLFAWEGNTSPQPPASTGTGELSAGSRWSADPAALQKQWTPTPDFAGASEPGPATPTGFLAFTLDAPEYLFGQSLYPAAVTKIALDNAVAIVATTQPKTPPTPETITPAVAFDLIKVRVARRKTILSRLKHLVGLKDTRAARWTFHSRLFPLIQQAGAFAPGVVLFVSAAHLDATEVFKKLPGLEKQTFADQAEFQTVIAKTLGIDATKPEGADCRDEIIGWLGCLLYQPPPVPPASLQLLPPPPLVPLATNVRVDYTAHAVLTPPADDAGAGPTPWDRWWQLSPLAMRVPSRPDTLLPPVPAGGCLYLGLADAQPDELLSLFFVLEDVAAPAIPSVPDAPLWQWLVGDSWQDATAAVHDDTQHFLRSGIVQLELPANLTTVSTVMPSGLAWLRVNVPQPAAHLRTLKILPHAVTAAWSPPEGSTPDAIAAHFAQLLPAGAITALAVPDPAVEEIAQPLPSRRGAPPETDREFDTRVSERLRHKGRAVAAGDYERLVVQRFPEVFHARVVPPGRAEEAGEVTVVVLPTMTAPPAVSPPGFSPGDLAVFAQALQAIAPLSATVRVINPGYERVCVTVEVKFAADHSPDCYRRQLTEELRTFFSPWIYDQAHVTDPAAPRNLSALRAFIRRRSYVRQVGACAAGILGADGGILPSDPSGALLPSSATTLLIAAEEHHIALLP